MKFIELSVTLGLAWFLAANLVASLLVLFVARHTRRIWAGRPAARAALLFVLRVAPAVLSVVFVAAIFAPAFWRLEPRNTAESIGPMLIVFAVAAAGIIGTAVWRGITAIGQVRRQAAHWMAGATPLAVDKSLRAFAVRDDFPVVSLVGIARPRLFIARQVLEGLTPAELQAAVAHEIGHWSSWDNLKRLAFICCPDPLTFSRAGRALQREWARLTELAADGQAAGRDVGRRLDLASALVKVARLAPATAAAAGPYSSLHDGSDVAVRVRRLADPESPADTGRRTPLDFRTGLMLIAIVALALACSHVLPQAIQQASESIVHLFA